MNYIKTSNHTSTSSVKNYYPFNPNNEMQMSEWLDLFAGAHIRNIV